MTNKDKVLRKFLNNPCCLRFAQIAVVLIDLGFEGVEARGSHKKFKHTKIVDDLIIPVHNNDCKDFYKHLTAKLIKKYLL